MSQHRKQQTYNAQIAETKIPARERGGGIMGEDKKDKRQPAKQQQQTTVGETVNSKAEQTKQHSTAIRSEIMTIC